MGGRTRQGSIQTASAGALGLRSAMAWVLMAALSQGCENKPTPESYYPLGAGYSWKYVLSGEVEAFAGWALHREGWKRHTTSRNLDNYLVVVETREPQRLNGIETTPFLASSNLNQMSWATFTAKSDQGFADIALSRRKADPKPFDTPRFFLRFPIREGRGWDVSEPWDFAGDEIEMSGRATIVAIDDKVTVPAGVFRHCVRVETETSGNKRVENLHGRGIGGQASFDRKKVEWFAPGVGLVKATEVASITPEILGGAEQMLELAEFRRGAIIQ